MHQRSSLNPDPSVSLQGELKKNCQNPPNNRFGYGGAAQRAYVRSKSNAGRDNERPLTNIVNIAKV